MNEGDFKVCCMDTDWWDHWEILGNGEQRIEKNEVRFSLMITVFFLKEIILFYFIYLLYLSAVGLVVGWWQNKYDAGDDPDPIHVISPVDKKRKL